MPEVILIAREDFCYGTIVRAVENIPKQNILHLGKFRYQRRNEVRFCTAANIFAKFVEGAVAFDALVSSGAESAAAFQPRATPWVPPTVCYAP
jgi:hypothetical protein